MPGPHRARLSGVGAGAGAGAAGKGVADLFLDSPEYNAHGTATEVRGGGAVARHRGQSFPGVPTDPPPPVLNGHAASLPPY